MCVSKYKVTYVSTWTKIKHQHNIIVHVITWHGKSSCYYMAWKEKLSGHASIPNILINLDLSILTLWIKSTNWFYFNLWKCSLHIMNYRPQTTLKWEMKEYCTTGNIFFRFSHSTVNLYSNSLFPEDNKSYRIKQWHMNIRSFVANEQRQTIYTQYTCKYLRTHTYIHITPLSINMKY